LFDAFYLCPNVVNACKERKWHYMDVGKSNQWFTVGSIKHKLAKYGRNVLHNSGIWCNITGLRKTKKYRLAEPISKLKDRMRRIVWRENVQDVIKYSHEKPVIRRMAKLLAA